MDAILTLARNRIQVQEGEDGSLRPVVVGDDGTAALSPKVGSTDPMSFDELIDGMKASKVTGGLFRVPESGGSGSRSQASGGRPTPSQNGSASTNSPLGMPSAAELIRKANEASMTGQATGPSS